MRDVGVDGKIILKWIIRNCCVRIWATFIWQTTRISGELPRTRQWNFGFHKRRGIHLTASHRLLASQEDFVHKVSSLMRPQLTKIIQRFVKINQLELHQDLTCARSLTYTLLLLYKLSLRRTSCFWMYLKMWGLMISLWRLLYSWMWRRIAW
jgi:hypothetical protein